MELDKKGQIKYPKQNIDEDKELISQGVRIEDLESVIQHTTIVPTHTPSNFREQFVVYDDGTNHRLYIYIDGAWKAFYSEDETCKSKAASGVRLGADGTGTVAITGLGFSPKSITFICEDGDGSSTGWGNSDGDFCISILYPSSVSVLGQTKSSAADTTDYWKVELNSIDTDGFTLGITKYGTPGNLNYRYLAFR